MKYCDWGNQISLSTLSIYFYICIYLKILLHISKILYLIILANDLQYSQLFYMSAFLLILLQLEQS